MPINLNEVQSAVWASVYAAVWAGDLIKHGHGVAEYAARMAHKAVEDLREEALARRAQLTP